MIDVASAWKRAKKVRMAVVEEVNFCGDNIARFLCAFDSRSEQMRVLDSATTLDICQEDDFVRTDVITLNQSRCYYIWKVFLFSSNSYFLSVRFRMINDVA